MLAGHPVFHFIDDNVTIQRQLQGGTNTNIVERCFLVVDFVIIGAQIRVNVDFVRDLFSVSGITQSACCYRSCRFHRCDSG